MSKIIAIAVLSAGLTSASWGARAGAPCLSSSSDPCDRGEYCHVNPAEQPGSQGTCVKRPDFTCMMAYRPVCGVDGKTYPNACQAAQASVDVAEDKACPAY